MKIHMKFTKSHDQFFYLFIYLLNVTDVTLKWKLGEEDQSQTYLQSVVCPPGLMCDLGHYTVEGQLSELM